MSKKSVLFGAVLIFAGLLLIGNTLDIFWFDFEDAVEVMLPFAIIALGFWLMVRKKDKHGPKINTNINDNETFSRSYEYTPPQPPPINPNPAPSTVAEEQASSFKASDEAHTNFDNPKSSERPSSEYPNKLRYSKSIGDMFINFDNIPLRNVEISMGIGDLEANFGGGILAEGLNRVVISGFIGDIRLFLPRNLPYQIHCSNTIGDLDLGGKFASGFGNNIDSQSPGYDSATSRLYIAANNFIGDIRIYHV